LLHLREAWLSLFHDLRLPWPAFSASVVTYNFCICLLYGGLLMLAFSLVRRHERMRSLLHDAAIARARTQTVLDETRLEFLQQQIDPALLLESMHELERRYRNDPERAERLLEKLVDFLRCAMPGLRSTQSTVTTELHLARAYAALQQEREVDARWRIEGSAEGVEHAPFPSLLMLPLLAQVRGKMNPSLRMASANGRVELSVHGTGDVVSAELADFLRMRLRNLYGNKFSMVHDRSAYPQLQITLSLDHN
jgi:LytS/YehU family sensor histidine kinase